MNGRGPVILVDRFAPVITVLRIFPDESEEMRDEDP